MRRKGRRPLHQANALTAACRAPYKRTSARAASEPAGERQGQCLLLCPGRRAAAIRAAGFRSGAGPRSGIAPITCKAVTGATQKSGAITTPPPWRLASAIKPSRSLPHAVACSDCSSRLPSSCCHWLCKRLLALAQQQQPAAAARSTGLCNRRMLIVCRRRVPRIEVRAGLPHASGGLLVTRNAMSSPLAHQVDAAVGEEEFVANGRV